MGDRVLGVSIPEIHVEHQDIEPQQGRVEGSPGRLLPGFFVRWNDSGWKIGYQGVASLDIEIDHGQFDEEGFFFPQSDEDEAY